MLIKLWFLFVNICILIKIINNFFQTGPKGVIKDWREYKRLEVEKREEQERIRNQLAKKLTLTCRSHVSIVI